MVTINLMLVFKIICLLILGFFEILIIKDSFLSGEKSFFPVVIAFLSFALPFIYILIH